MAKTKKPCFYTGKLYGEHGKVHAIAYVITNSMENLCFDKEGYFHVLVNISPRVPIRYRNTCGSKLGILWKHSTTLQARVSTSTCVSISVWKHRKCFPLARREAPAEGRRPAGEGANIDRRLVPYHAKSMRIQSRIEFIYIYIYIFYFLI